jgi:hypothetical protein
MGKDHLGADQRRVKDDKKDEDTFKGSSRPCLNEGPV